VKLHNILVILKKNRWANILPYDDTRVVLTTIPGVEGSDYINANWISDLQGSNRAYICTQGPVQNTIGDFWRMTFEYRVSVIVMLTRLIEDDKEKCVKYWPNESQIYDNIIEVILLSEEKSPTIITRKMKMRMNNEERECTQIQFTAWPDHGLPSPEEDYIALSDKSDEANLGHGPIVVHCSAGVGRSGTFCTVHSYIHFLRDHVKNNNVLPPMSIANAVISLRKERSGMVQTTDQYEFCYRTVYKEFEKHYLNLKSLNGTQNEKNNNIDENTNSQQNKEENNNTNQNKEE